MYEQRQKNLFENGSPVAEVRNVASSRYQAFTPIEGWSALGLMSSDVTPAIRWALWHELLGAGLRAETNRRE
jgi:hypothetical protein